MIHNCNQRKYFHEPIVTFNGKIVCKLGIKIFSGNLINLIVLCCIALHCIVLMFAYLTPTGITQKSQPNLTIKGNTVKPLVSAYESFRTMLGRNCASLAYGDGRDFNSPCFKIFYSCEKSISRKKICYFLLRNFLHLYNPGMPDPYLGAICVFWGERRLDTRVITLPHLNPPYYPIFSSQKTRNSYWV